LRGPHFIVCPAHVAWMIGPGATEFYEPGQVRKEAALSRFFRVPPVLPVGVGDAGNVWERDFEEGVHDPFGHPLAACRKIPPPVSFPSPPVSAASGRSGASERGGW